MRLAPVALAALAALAGCRRLSDREAVELVEAYDARLAEAYRASDARLLEPLAGPRDARRVATLIGVKADVGLTLDARLLELRVVAVERPPGEVRVRTEERWHYRDRRIGSGEQVGPDSTDRYALAYTLRRAEGRWVVDEVAFERPPEVGRAPGPAPGAAPAGEGR